MRILVSRPSIPYRNEPRGLSTEYNRPKLFWFGETRRNTLTMTADMDSEDSSVSVIIKRRITRKKYSWLGFPPEGWCIDCKLAGYAEDSWFYFSCSGIECEDSSQVVLWLIGGELLKKIEYLFKYWYYCDVPKWNGC